MTDAPISPRFSLGPAHQTVSDTARLTSLGYTISVLSLSRALSTTTGTPV